MDNPGLKSNVKIVGSNVSLQNRNDIKTQIKGFEVFNYMLWLDGITTLKEYYEIVGESRPLSAFFPTHADFFTEMHFYSWN